MRLGKLTTVLAALMATGALAQVPLTPMPASPTPNDPDATLVEELVVTARYPGPAWWRVSDADSTVYVLGVPSVMPKSMKWDTTALDRYMTGADRLILPFNSVSISVLRAPGSLIRLAQIRSSKPIEEKLPPELKARFVAARTGIGQPAGRYRYDNALAAGVLLAGDYRTAVRLTASDPGKTIARMAQARGLKTETKAYDVGPLLGAAARTPKAAQRACLDDALDEVEAGPAGARRAAEAWAAGDVRGALGGERGYEKCLAGATGALALDAKLKADTAGAIAQALKVPGHSVALVQLRPLLAQGGVLDRLQAQGYTIKTPGDE